MIHTDEEYFIEMFDTKRARALGRVAIDVDWVPAAEDLVLQQLREGTVASLEQTVDARIEPVWNERSSGPPKVRGFRVASPATSSKLFSLSYFASYADRVASKFVQSGDLESGDVFEYNVLAVPRRSEAPARPRICVTSNAPAVPIVSAPLRPLMNRALQIGVDDARDLPAFVHWSVLEECAVLTRRAGAMETGGVLIGKICRDEHAEEIFLEITAQIAAPAHGELTKLSFTADTWTRVQAAINQRCTREIWCGWWHSHSYTKCESLNRKTSSDDESSSQVRGRQPASAFLSEEDKLLHRVVFPKAYSLALLITDSPDSGMSWSAFGWRGGQITPRAFHLIDVPLPKEFHVLGENHATQSNTATAATHTDRAAAIAAG